MELAEFEEQTTVIARNQPQYRPLPAHIARDDQGTVTFCWQLTREERMQVLKTGRIWHQVLTFGLSLQPQLLSTEKPEMK